MSKKRLKYNKKYPLHLKWGGEHNLDISSFGVEGWIRLYDVDFTNCEQLHVACSDLPRETFFSCRECLQSLGQTMIKECLKVNSAYLLADKTLMLEVMHDNHESRVKIESPIETRLDEFIGAPPDGIVHWGFENEFGEQIIGEQVQDRWTEQVQQQERKKAKLEQRKSK